MQPAISISGLNKIYQAKTGDYKHALQDIDLEIPQGSFFGLLGPNGAGKSTIINILAGIVKKTSGTVKVCGYDIDTNEREVKYNLGVVPQELILDPFFTVEEALDFHAGYYGVSKQNRKTAEIIQALKLEDKMAVNSRRLSGGMRRRLLIGKALVHSPKVLILDEPTAGVDIELRQQLWEYALKLNKNGTTIVLTTHYLEEADKLCDKIAIINHGKIVACDRKSRLLKNVQSKTITFTLENPPENINLANATLNNNILEVRYNPQETSIMDVIEKVKSVGFNITDLVSKETKLEDVFIQMTS